MGAIQRMCDSMLRQYVFLYSERRADWRTTVNGPFTPPMSSPSSGRPDASAWADGHAIGLCRSHLRTPPLP